jgi:hypothetical protein
MLQEYDFSGGVRGKYAKRASVQKEKNAVDKAREMLRDIVDDYDDTGCEECGVVSESLIEKASNILKSATPRWLVRAESEKSGSICMAVEAKNGNEAVKKVASLCSLRVVRLKNTYLCENGVSKADLKDELRHNLGYPRRSFTVITVIPLQFDINLE